MFEARDGRIYDLTTGAEVTYEDGDCLFSQWEAENETADDARRLEIVNMVASLIAAAVLCVAQRDQRP